MAYLWYLRGKFVSGTCLPIICRVAVAGCCFFGLRCAVKWGLYVDHSSSTVGYMCDVGGIFVQGHMSVM